MSLWAVLNVTHGVYFTNGARIELYEEDEAFAMACSFTTSGPLGGPVWKAVEMAEEDADDLAEELGLIGVYVAAGEQRRWPAWSDRAPFGFASTVTYGPRIRATAATRSDRNQEEEDT